MLSCILTAVLTVIITGALLSAAAYCLHRHNNSKERALQDEFVARRQATIERQANTINKNATQEWAAQLAAEPEIDSTP